MEDYAADLQRINSCILYILLKVCKLNKADHQVEEYSSKYKPINYQHFKWIVDRINFVSSVRYGITIIPNKYMSVCEELSLVPETFRNKASNKNKRYIFFENISMSDFECINYVIFRYKLYGKFVENLKLMLYNIFHKR